MEINLSTAAREALERAAAGAKRTRQWRRYQAVLLLAQGQEVAAVAHALGASVSGVYQWAARFRQAGLAGLAEGAHRGRVRRFDATGEAWLDGTLASDPHGRGYQVAGWTVPLLLREAAQAGYAVSEQTLRRTIRRLGWRWKRPKYVLGRPDPEYAQKKRR
jgi:transposase